MRNNQAESTLALRAIDGKTKNKMKQNRTKQQKTNLETGLIDDLI